MTIRSAKLPRARALALAIAAVAALALAAAGSSAASVRQGPAGLAFYHPPKQPPTGGHGSLIWARKAGGLVPLPKASSTKLVLYTSRTPQGKAWRRFGLGQRPQGQAAEGRLARDHLRARDHRHGRRLRALARRQGGPATPTSPTSTPS